MSFVLFCFFKLSSISHHFFPFIQTQGRGQTRVPVTAKLGFLVGREEDTPCIW